MKQNNVKAPITFFSNLLMMYPESCQHYLDTLNERAALIGFNIPVKQQQERNVNGVAVIPIYDILSHRSDAFMDFMFGGTSYMDIGKLFADALSDPSIKSIVFDINSPGGEVAGVFDLVDDIYNARGIKPIYAVANEMAYSAAYAIASAADKVYLTRTAGVGSIGILAVHVDRTENDKAEGLRYNMIYAGDKKIDFSSHVQLSEEARAELQKDVNAQYAIFIDTVARNRGLKAADVKGTKAGTFRGRNAVEAGLADAVLSWNQVMSKITGKIKNKGGIGMKALIEQINALFAERTDLTLSAVMADMGYIPKLADGSIVLTEAEVTAIKEDAIKQGKEMAAKEHSEQMTAVIDICTTSGMVSMLPDLIKKNATADEAKTAIIAEQQKKTNHISSTVDGLKNGESNALLDDAKARAGKK